MRILKLINGGTLVCYQPPAIYREFVLLRLTPKNGMVLEDQAIHLRARLTTKEKGGSQSTDSAPHNHAIVGLAGVCNVLRKGVVKSVADGVPRPKDIQRIAVGI